jgi:hydroxyacylglutathione hydrolase
MILQTMRVGPLGVNCYLIGDESTREAILVDPGGNAHEILAALKQHRLTLKCIVNTHAHFDHVMAVDEIRTATRAPFLIHTDEAPVLTAVHTNAASFGIALRQPAPADRLLRDGDVVSAGAVDLQVLHTPGHTPGGICLLTGSCVFVGDTLFQGSIGRTDLPGGNYAALMQSIRDKLLPLADLTVVYPGHGPSTTIAEEKQLNPFIRPLITGIWNA